MLLDANLLIYAHDASSPFHARAHAWFDEQLNGPRRVAFLRLTTNPRVAARPLGPVQAWAHVATWFTSPVAWTPVPTERHASCSAAWSPGCTSEQTSSPMPTWLLWRRSTGSRSA